MRHRLKSPPHTALVEHVSGPGLQRDAATVWPFMLQAHLAHALMLRECRIIPVGAAQRLIEGLLELEEAGPTVLAFDPTIEDLYFNIERYLSENLGSDVAGWLQTGRSRNDHYACVARLWTRAELLAVAGQVQGLRSAMLELAQAHAGTVMTGYTHQQPAQPITFGHYLLGVEASLARDHARIVDGWSRVNLSPLGAGSMAGVSWPIDRDLLAHLLGFARPLSNSVDSVASRDFAAELVAAFALLAVTISRVAADLQQFVSWEFGGMEVNDDVAAVSSVMPQKKNPVSLEHCKGASGQVIGALVSMLASVKSAPFSHHRESSVESMRAFPEAVAQAKKTVALLEATLAGLIVKPEILSQRAGENFSTATDLADLLVREGGLTFRQAHGVVGSGVRAALEAGEGPSWFTPERLRELVEVETGAELGLAEEQLLTAISPRGSVEARNVPGGPALESVTKQHGEAIERLQADITWQGVRGADVAAVPARLEAFAAAASSSARTENG